MPDYLRMGAAALTGGMTEGGGLRSLAGYLDPAKPYNQAAGGAKTAAGQYGNLANEQKQFQLQGLGQQQQAIGGLQDVYNRMYGAGGEGAGPGALESYYSRTSQGSDPYFNRVLQQGTQNLNASMAQSGGFGSGARAAALGNLSSGLEAQMYRDRGAMAAAAQNAQMGRLGQQFGSQAGITGMNAGAIQNAYGLGGQMYGQEMGNSINAQNQAAQLSAQGGGARQKMIYDLAKSGLQAAMA